MKKSIILNLMLYGVISINSKAMMYENSDNVISIDISDLNSGNISKSALISEVDFRGGKDITSLISQLMSGKYNLSRLEKIDCSNSNIEIYDLYKLQEINPVGGFIRPLRTISSRFCAEVAVIRVDIAGTKLARSQDKRWDLNNIIQKPVSNTSHIRYLADNSTSLANLQLILSFS